MRMLFFEFCIVSLKSDGIVVTVDNSDYDRCDVNGKGNITLPTITRKQTS